MGRISQLTEITTIDDADELYGVDVSDLTHSPDGSSRKFTKQNLLKEVVARVTDNETDILDLQGRMTTSEADILDIQDNITNIDSLILQLQITWVGITETLTYASATTMTAVGDLTSKFQKGDKIRVTQTTDKFFYLIGVSESGGITTFTLAGGDDYSLVDATITNPCYSRSDNPFGFPSKFSWRPTLTASGSMTWTVASIDHAYFHIVNGWLIGQVRLRGTTGGTASNQLRFTMPVPTTNITNNSTVGNGSIIEATG